MAQIYSRLESGAKTSLPAEYQSHYLHCVDYLRQAIMCSGDVAMEAHTPGESGDNGPLDGGWSGYHGKRISLFGLLFHQQAGRFLLSILDRMLRDTTVCKDYSQVIHYLEGEP